MLWRHQSKAAATRQNGSSISINSPLRVLSRLEVCARRFCCNGFASERFGCQFDGGERSSLHRLPSREWARASLERENSCQGSLTTMAPIAALCAGVNVLVCSFMPPPFPGCSVVSRKSRSVRAIEVCAVLIQAPRDDVAKGARQA